MRVVAGFAMLCAPFVWWAYACGRDMGVQWMLKCLSGILALVAWIFVAMYLVTR